jgi:hypothetical protein
MKRTKRILSFILAVVLAFSVFTLTASAMSINVSMPSGDTITLDVEPTDLIEDVKAQIEAIENMPAAQQQLTFAGRELEDGNNLQYYSIQRDSVLRLTIRQQSETYSIGDIIEYGTYPQSRVEETEALRVTAQEATWKSFKYYYNSGDNYYSGANSEYDGNMTPGDFMRFADFFLDGKKYRAVYFTDYRPYRTGYQCGADYSYVDNNGYETKNYYYFAYEPVKWRVLDPYEGLIISDKILDSQAYNNYVFYSDGKCWGSADKTYYASDYENSSIRQWLNDDFYNTVFADTQKENIRTSELDNRGYYTLTDWTGYEDLDSASTNDKVFLLSYSEVQNSEYGFENDEDRQVQGSDYSKCQGLLVESGNSLWRLRSSGGNSGYTCSVIINGFVSNACYTSHTGEGVRPALKLLDLKSDTEISPILYSERDTIKYGNYPQSKVTDAETLAALNIALKEDGWVSYDYYSGTDTLNDGNMAPANYMIYQDVCFDGVKYRAVIFDRYRPLITGNTSSEANSFQDDNGYNLNTVYWFKYEPIEWRVLDPDSGLILCKSAIDSQAYNNYILYADGEYWGNAEKTYRANDYANSSIRAWLNDDFINTAFSPAQQANIKLCELNNSCPGYSSFNSSNTLDKVFLLSYFEALNSAYGFNSEARSKDTARQITSSDYAKCQGVRVINLSESENGGNSYWRLRSPAGNTGNTCAVGYNGIVAGEETCDTGFTYAGVVPALKLLNLESDTEIYIPSPANYSALDALIDTIPADLSVYTDETVTALGLVLDSIDRDLLIEDQDVVDGYVDAVSQAIAALYLEPTAAISADKIVRGQRATWTVFTPDDVLWLRFTNNYTTASGGTGKVITSCKYDKANAGSTEISVSDENGLRTWTVSMPFTYAGTAVSADELFNVEYKRSGSNVWESFKVLGEGGVKVPYEKSILVAKTADIFTPATSNYNKYETVSVTADKDAGTMTVVTTDDVSKIRICYTDANTGKSKSTAYQTTSTSLISCESENGLTTWVVKYKFNPAQDNTYTVQSRGPAWGEGKSISVTD